jgi:hypothetical protein
MKLSPPASSSDLEAARDVARRLHQRRRRQDRPGPEEPAYQEVSRPQPESPLAPAPPPPAQVTPAVAVPAPPEPPSWDDPAGELSLPGDAGDPLAGFGEPGVPAEAVAEAPEPPPEAGLEESGVSPEEMVGSNDGPPFDALPEPEAEEVQASPFDVELDDADTSPEGDYGAPVPPSWDDIVETSLGLAQASGAMLVDPSGQVFAARGNWPEPGPDAIAAKLVSTMARTLKDAPTRSISAPLMGKHLTAWRVPLAEGLVTAAFIGDAPVRAEARPAIDTEIHRGAGA